MALTGDDEENGMMKVKKTSSDEALCEMLGLDSKTSFRMNIVEHDDDDSTAHPSQFGIPKKSAQEITECVDVTTAVLYQSESMCIVPEKLWVPAAVMRKLTEELVWAGEDTAKATRTYETIRVWRTTNNEGVLEERRTLTRLEDFVNHHAGWNELCNEYLRKIISAIAGTEMVLFKEKLNLKPPGGSGFAPHLDTPSLRVALGDKGPTTFVTVMVAIDNMTVQNGCLRVCKGPWSKDNCCAVIHPEQDGNPDAGGRAGAIPEHVAETMDFQNITCRGGCIVAFHGWAPHRSSANQSPFPRRAVFLTYNPKSEGDFHDRYYERMEEIRSEWKSRVGLSDNGDNNQRLNMDAVEESELDALSTIPRI